MVHPSHYLIAVALLASAGSVLARGGQAPAEGSADAPATELRPAPPAAYWPQDRVEARRRQIERERAAFREQIEIERAAARRAIESDRQAWLERWRKERAQAQAERRAREELFRRQQLERFPQLEAHRRRHSEEFERRWREIEQRRQELVEQIEPQP
ncbi:MAG: hypothetical protein RLZ44_2 [Pseudomonadota bacterium]